MKQSPKKVESLIEGVRGAWQLRIRGDLAGSMARLSALNDELRLSASATGTPSGPALDALVLSLSLQRATGDSEPPRLRLADLEAGFKASGRPLPAILCYEKGMGLFSRGDFYPALDLFLQGSGAEGEPLYRLWCLTNAVFCLNNLGLPHVEKLREARSLLARLKAKHDVDKVEAQLSAFELRIQFREGKLERFPPPVSGPTSLDQRLYFRLWARLLPYHRGYRPPSDRELTAFLPPETGLDSHRYRLRTLQGVLHPDDWAVARPSEWVDRLYLWIWMWLANPDHFSFSRISLVLSNFPLSQMGHRLTVEDGCLLKNMLLWLELFEPSAEASLRKAWEWIPEPRNVAYPLFELEGLAIQYWKARRDREKTLSDDLSLSLRSHPLWKSPCHHFAEIISHTDGNSVRVPPPLERLAHYLDGILGVAPGEKRAWLVVDLDRWQIRAQKQNYYSESLCLALDLLRRLEAVPCEAFVEQCFGLSRFEPEHHLPKVYNLLSRLKRITSEKLRFSLREGLVRSEGNWDGVYFRKTRPRSGPVRLRFGQVEPAPLVPQPVSRLGGIRWEGALGRHELAVRLGRPRSTTNRLLNTWLQRGWISRVGKGKATRYCIKEST